MKKVIGVISIVLFIIVVFQSCAAGLSNALKDTGEISGGAGLILAFFMLIGGILLLVSKTSRGITITSLIFYLLGGVVGLTNAGTYTDLKIWATLNLIFAALLTINLIRGKSKIA